MISSLDPNQSQYKNFDSINFTCERCFSCIKLIGIFDEVSNSVKHFLTRLDHSTNAFKKWEFQPETFITDLHNPVVSCFCERTKRFYFHMLRI